MRPCKNTLINKHVVHAAPKSPRKCKIAHLTMRLNDAGVRQHKPKLIYLDHRPPPSVTEDATRDRSNRWLAGFAQFLAKHAAQSFLKRLVQAPDVLK